MPGDLRLTLFHNFHEVTDANLSPIHEVEKSQAGRISKRREQANKVERFGGVSHSFKYTL
jgi:hypothetical protein